MQTLSSGDVDTARAVLRDFIDATIWLCGAGQGDRNTAEKPDADVSGPSGNPTAGNLFSVIG